MNRLQRQIGSWLMAAAMSLSGGIRSPGLVQADPVPQRELARKTRARPPHINARTRMGTVMATMPGAAIFGRGITGTFDRRRTINARIEAIAPATEIKQLTNRATSLAMRWVMWMAIMVVPTRPASRITRWPYGA